jgi:Uma2 family endonuclease
MAAGAIVRLEEYLNTTYEPDCEYLDGELVERNAGKTKHALLQGMLFAYFFNRRKVWGITPIVEERVRIRERRYRIPDLCVIQGEPPEEDVLTTPPWIWIEILSPEDRPLRVQRKIDEVLDFGCEWVWVIDPEKLDSRVYTKESAFDLPDGIFRIPGTGIAVPLHEIDE